MSTAASIATTGLVAMQLSVDLVAQNLANMRTTAYQKRVIQTSDTFYRQVRAAGIPEQGGTDVRPTGIHYGTGVEVVGINRIYSENGQINITGRKLDIAIIGSGYIPVTMPNGTKAYTRAGALQLGADRRLKTIQGYVVGDGIEIPSDVSEADLSISQDGTINFLDENRAPQQAGQIQLSIFANENGLEPLSGATFLETESSGQANTISPGTLGVGVIRQGSLEESNVSAVAELTDLIGAQRSYEAVARVLSTANEMEREAIKVYD